MNIQVIEQNGTPEYAVIPMDDFNKLAADAEMLADIEAYHKAKKSISTGDSEAYPSEIVHSLLIDEANPVMVFRKYRGMTQAALAQAVGMQQAAIAQIEGGKRDPSVKQLRKLAKVLDVDMEMLLAADDED